MVTDDICEYFGVKIAMYFAYLGHYTGLLTIPTVLGILVWFLQAESQVMELIRWVQKPEKQCFTNHGMICKTS